MHASGRENPIDYIIIESDARETTEKKYIGEEVRAKDRGRDRECDEDRGFCDDATSVLPWYKYSIWYINI